MTFKRLVNLAFISALTSAANLGETETGFLHNSGFEKKVLSQTTQATIDLNANGNYLFYTGSANFGTPSQVTDGIIFDTTQSGIQISGNPCGVCVGNKCNTQTICTAYYNQTDSSSYNVPGTTPIAVTNSSLAAFNTSAVSTFNAQDTICYNTTCKNDVPFTVINYYSTASSPFQFYSGTIGVGPSSELFGSSTNGVGFDLKLASQQSQLNVGSFAAGYSQASFSNFTLASGAQTAWNVGLLNVTAGSTWLNSAGNRIAIISTASGTIQLTQADYQTFITNIQYLPEMDCTTALNGLQPNCQSITTQCAYYISEWPQFFPDISINIGGTVFTIPPTAYLAEKINGYQCQVMIGWLPSNTGIVLGTPFMRQYYTYLDFGAQTVGFAQSLNPPVLSPTTGGAVKIGWTVVATFVVTLFGILFVSWWIWVEWFEMACYEKKAEAPVEPLE